jgi:hypothetical protein
MATRIAKALSSFTATKASRGTLSNYVLNAPHSTGQPPSQYGDVMGLITADRMREIVMKTHTAGASMNAALDYACGVKLTCRNVDPGLDPVLSQLKVMQQYLRTPNSQEGWREFSRKLLRDIFTLGYGFIELEKNASGGIANLWVLDAARTRVDYDEHGIILGYNQLDARGMPIRAADGEHAWEPEEVIFFSLDGQSSNVYPTSRIAQLFSAAVLEDLMMHFISQRFTDSNIPYGLLDLGDITEPELRGAIALWNQQVAQLGQHKIMLTGSKGSKFFPFAGQLKDLEATALLTTIRSRIMGIIGVTVNELGEAEDVNKSNGFNLSYTFKKRVIEPLLDCVTDKLTQRLLWQTLGFTQMELGYEEIDSRDELLQSQIDDMYHKMGVISVNDIRNRKGLKNTEGGELLAVFSGAAWIPVHLVESFAEAQLLALQAIDQQTLVSTQMMLQAPADGTSDAQTPPPNISPPMLRGIQEPEKFTTIDGTGSSTAKIKLPKPQVSPTPKPDKGPQKPRGPVQAARNAGARKENMSP